MTLFNDIAGIYDRLNRLMTFGVDVLWRRRMVRLLPAARETLDIACGTGDVCRELKRRFPRMTVRGLDESAGMLAIARRKCPEVAFTEGDVLAADWGNPDAVTCAFGFRNFTDKRAVLAKAARVLPPGGALLVLELWRPSAFVRAGVSLWLRICTACFAPGRGAAYAYLRRSIELTLTTEDFIRLAVEEGFRPQVRRYYLPSATVLLFVRGDAPRPKSER